MSKKYLIAVSGGNDSMALLDMCIKHHIKVEVAHINYHKRETSDIEMELVLNYCKKNQIKVHVKEIFEYPKNGNFQDYARKIRYDYFEQLISENNLDGLLVAHHLDDCIETYIMQKMRKGYQQVLGLTKKRNYHNIIIYRPLLNYTKKELRNYCQTYQVPYHDDESNASEDYLRNRVRHHYVDYLTKIEKQKIKKEIDKANKEIIIVESDKIEITKDLSLKQLMSYFNNRGLYKVSNRQLKDLEKLIVKQDRFKINWQNFTIKYKKPFLQIYCNKKPYYKFVFNDMDSLVKSTSEFYQIQGNGGYGLNLKDEDFPIIIRNWQSGDKIHLSFGHKKVSRYLIDNKIADEKRLNWPVIENSSGKIIFVYGIGMDVEHKSNNYAWFMIK